MTLIELLFYMFVALLSLIWLALVGLSLASLNRDGEEYRINKGFRPKVLVVLPFKGNDPMFKEGLMSLKAQDYAGHYDILAVADSKYEKAINIVEKLGIKYVLRKNVCKKCSNKVMALMTAFKGFPDYDVYVVVDSDVVCRKDWLRSLVLPLSDKKVCLSTTFPHFRPMDGAGFWADVKEMWGFIGNSLLSSPKTRFAWGGSMAFKRKLLDDRFYKDFSSAISDDIAITKTAHRMNLKIYYVKEMIAVIPSNDNFNTFVEWSNRQTAFMILGNKKVFASGTIYYSASILLFLSAIALSFYNLTFLIFFVPFIMGFAKTYARSENRKLDIIPIYLMMNFIYLANLVTTKRKHDVVWRGIKYRI